MGKKLDTVSGYTTRGGRTIRPYKRRHAQRKKRPAGVSLEPADWKKV